MVTASRRSGYTITKKIVLLLENLADKISITSCLKIFWEQATKFFFIGEERGFKFYAIRGGYDLPSAQFRYEYDIIGRKPDGTWVKYLNTGKLLKQYIGKDYACLIQNVTTSGNTIIMQYKILEYKLRRVTDGRCGELRFKWDETAQWFGVEQVRY